MTRQEWWDLSDSELRVRLEQRGIRPDAAYALARDRDDPWVASMIDEALAR